MNLLECRPRKGCHPVRDPVVTVLRVPAKVAIESISHVDELLGNDNFKRPGPRPVDTRQVDQNEVIAGCRCVGVSSTNRRPHPPPQPALKNAPLHRDPETIDRQLQEDQIPLE